MRWNRPPMSSILLLPRSLWSEMRPDKHTLRQSIPRVHSGSAFVGISACLSSRRQRRHDVQPKQPFTLLELLLCCVNFPRYASMSLLHVWDKHLGVLGSGGLEVSLLVLLWIKPAQLHSAHVLFSLVPLGSDNQFLLFTGCFSAQWLHQIWHWWAFSGQPRHVLEATWKE